MRVDELLPASGKLSSSAASTAVNVRKRVFLFSFIESYAPRSQSIQIFAKVANRNPKPSRMPRAAKAPRALGPITMVSPRLVALGKMSYRYHPHGQSCRLKHSPATDSHARQRRGCRARSLPGDAFHRPGPRHVKRSAAPRVKHARGDYLHASRVDAAIRVYCQP